MTDLQPTSTETSLLRSAVHVFKRWPLRYKIAFACGVFVVVVSVVDRVVCNRPLFFRGVQTPSVLVVSRSEITASMALFRFSAIDLESGREHELGLFVSTEESYHRLTSWDPAGMLYFLKRYRQVFRVKMGPLSVSRLIELPNDVFTTGVCGFDDSIAYVNGGALTSQSASGDTRVLLPRSEDNEGIGACIGAKLVLLWRPETERRDASAWFEYRLADAIDGKVEKIDLRTPDGKPCSPELVGPGEGEYVCRQRNGRFFFSSPHGVVPIAGTDKDEFLIGGDFLYRATGQNIDVLDKRTMAVVRHLRSARPVFELFEYGGSPRKPN